MKSIIILLCILVIVSMLCGIAFLGPRYELENIISEIYNGGYKNLTYHFSEQLYSQIEYIKKDTTLPYHENVVSFLNDLSSCIFNIINIEMKNINYAIVTIEYDNLYTAGSFKILMTRQNWDQKWILQKIIDFVVVEYK